MEVLHAFRWPNNKKMFFGRYVACSKGPAIVVGLIHLILLLGMMIYCAAALSKYASCSLPIIVVFYAPFFLGVLFDSHLIFFGVFFLGAMVQVCNVIGVCLCLRHFFMHLSYYVTSAATKPHGQLADGIIKEKNLWAGIILFILFIYVTDFALSVYVSYWRYLYRKSKENEVFPSSRKNIGDTVDTPRNAPADIEYRVPPPPSQNPATRTHSHPPLATLQKEKQLSTEQRRSGGRNPVEKRESQNARQRRYEESKIDVQPELSAYDNPPGDEDIDLNDDDIDDVEDDAQTAQIDDC